MVLTIKHRFGIYRRFERDIWGISFCKMDVNNKLTDFFFGLYLNKAGFKHGKVRRYVYRVDLIDPKGRRKTKKWRFISLRLVKLFYLTLRYHQFRAYAIKASRSDGFFKFNYCFLLEGRLISLLYRSNFIISMFEIVEYVKRGKILINGFISNYVNKNLNIGDIVSFHNIDFLKLRSDFLKRLRMLGFIFNTPRYLFISYKLFFIFMEKILREFLFFKKKKFFFKKREVGI